MPAYEPGGHQASDSLYDQATSATQVTRMGAKTSVKAVQGVAGAVGGAAAHTYQGIRTVVGRVKYGKPLGPKMTFKGRVSRRVFLLRKGLKGVSSIHTQGRRHGTEEVSRSVWKRRVEHGRRFHA